MKTLSEIIIIILFSVAAFAQAGELDNTFGGDGKVTTYIQSFGAEIHSLAIQTDGKIVAAGTSKSGVSHSAGCLARYNTNGTVDSSFNGSGISIYGGLPYRNAVSVAIQSDGKIVFVGDDFNTGYIARLNTDGIIDASFGIGGIFEDPSFTFAHSLAIQTDGKIIAAGGGGFTVIRYNEDGTRDSTFGIGGIVTNSNLTNALSVVIQTDGKILTVTSSYFTSSCLVRLNTDGTLDSSFNSNGIVATNIGIEFTSSPVIIQPDGKIIVAGSSGLDFAMARYNTNGMPDSSFGLGGQATTYLTNSTLSSMALQSDGKIIAVGVAGNYASDFAVARFNSNGALDDTFGTNGILSTDFNDLDDAAFSVAIEPDQTIVVAGYAKSIYPWTEFAVARYLSGLELGILNFSSSPTSLLIYPNPIHQTETLEYTLTKNESLTIALYDVNGRLIRNFISNEDQAAGAHKETLNIGELTSGNYFLTISNGEQKMSVKIVKQ
ncbi:MAG TPA: T9SS type A sorting domain-containing protein [Chitinophagales bacterium]|nr:T9SS type A sorting domain-containing protein [Chitinophagales bacterium]